MCVWGGEGHFYTFVLLLSHLNVCSVSVFVFTVIYIITKFSL